MLLTGPQILHTFGAQSGPMRNHPGRVIAAGILCSLAATVALWSGPLASASGALHSSATQHVSRHSGLTADR
jgi:hypothetical protein